MKNKKLISFLLGVLTALLGCVLCLCVAGTYLKSEKEGMIILIIGGTGILYVCAKIRAWIRGEEREAYEGIPFIGMVAVIFTFFRNMKSHSELVKFATSNLMNERLFIARTYMFRVLVIVIIAAIVYVRVKKIKNDTEEYNKGEKVRAMRAKKAYEKDLDRAIDYSIDKISRANTYEDKRYYEAKLERAKAKREKYYLQHRY